VEGAVIVFLIRPPGSAPLSGAQRVCLMAPVVVLKTESARLIQKFNVHGNLYMID